MSNYFLGNYRCIRNIKSGDHQLIVLEGRNAEEINSYLVRERISADVRMMPCEVIPLSTEEGDTRGFHIRDCTIEIYDNKEANQTHLIITNKNSKKRKVSLGELEKCMQKIPKKAEVTAK